MVAAKRHVEDLLPDSTALSRLFVQSIYERFDGTLRSFLMSRLRNEADVQDFAQEVYLRFTRLRNPRKIRSERAFLFTIATNLLHDRNRRLATQLHEASVSTDDVTLTCRSYDPANRILDSEQLDRLVAAVADLSEGCRRAFWMSRIEGLTYAEIADRLGVSVSMVEKHISAAMRRLRIALND